MANILPVQNNIKGTLDLDSEFGEVRSGNYVGAENVQFISKEGNESIPKQPFIGNKLLFDKGSVEVQNKRFRLFFDLGDTFSFQVFGTNNVTQLSSLFVVPSNASYAAYRSAIQGFLTSAGLTSTITIGTDHLNIEITSVATYDYQFRVSNASAGVRVIVTQESVAANFSGFLKDIGSFDLNGDLFIFSTPQEELPEEVTVSGVNSAGVVTTVVAHGLSAGDEVRLAGSGANDGILLVNVVLSATTFSYHYPAGVATVGGVITKNYTGVGEIGVAQFNEQAETGTYTRLLMSKEFGFNTLHQIDCDGEINPLGKSLYFNQYKYNQPRVFYYSGAYVTDGALTYVIPENRYEYGTIDLETSLVINKQTAKIDLVNVGDGGSLPCGNRQYFLRLLTSRDALAGSDFHAFTPNINIYAPQSSGSPNLIHGSDFSVLTDKSVTLQISNVDTEIYSQYELCVVEKNGLSTLFKVIVRNDIPAETFTYTNTGFEQSTVLSIDEVFRKNSNIANIGGQRIVDNRLVLHDINYEQERDFSDWATTFTHQIERVRIDGEGGITDGYKFGGYLDSSNTFNIVGFSWYETYRIGIRVYFKDGGASRVFWVDDIKVDISGTNVTTPNRRAGGVLSPGIFTPSLFDLSDINKDFIVPCIRISNINLDYLIDGVRVRDLAGKIEVMMVDLDSSPGQKEILHHGLGVIGLNGIVRAFETVNGSLNVQVGSLFSDLNGQRPDVFPFPFISGQSLMKNSVGTAFGSTQAPPYSSMINAFSSLYRPTITPLIGPGGSALSGRYFVMDKTLFLYSNDFFYGNSSYSYVQGDKIINWGKASNGAATFDRTVSTNEFSFVRDFNSYNNAFVPSFIDILSGGALTQYESKIFDNHGYSVAQINAQNRCGLEIVGGTANTKDGYTFERNIVLNLNSAINAPTPSDPGYNNNDDNGAYYVSIYRQKSYIDPDNSKFGNRKNSRYINTGQSIIVNENNPSVENVLFSAGDTFISRSYLKYLSNTFDQTPSGTSTGFIGAANGIAFISQSKVSARMRTYNDLNTSNSAFPTYPSDEIGQWLERLVGDQSEYNASYNNSKSDIEVAFDSEVNVSSFPSRVIWSDLKPDGSFFDSYRFFPPGQFNDYSRNYGPVVHIETLDDEFFVMQHRNFSREYFNTTGTITSDTDELVILGNAGVLARKGATITSYGSLHKWSCVKGRSASGRDVLYWFNAENGLFLKYGGRGAEPLSMAKGLNQWFNENSKFVYSHNTPAAGRGICGGWNERFQELRYTFRGYKNSPEWGVGNTYDKGDVVIYGGNGFVPVQLYLSRVDHISSPANIPGGNTVTWEAISEKDSRYYNVFTLVYNEMKDGFTSFLSPKPLIYHRWRNNLLTQRYGEWSQYPNYLENFGDYNTWYSSEEGELAEDGFVIPVINYNSDVIKKFSALYVDSEVAPDRVEFFTPEHESFLVLSDFESREGMWVSTIKNDILTAPNGINDGDTSRLFGRYLLVKVFFSPKKFQSLRNIRVRLQFNSRYLQT